MAISFIKRGTFFFVAFLSTLFMLTIPTQAQDTITLRAVSRTSSQGYALFSKDGSVFWSGSGGAGGARGINIAVINEYTGEVIRVVNIDTYPDRNSDAILAVLNAIEPGRIVMAGVGDYNVMTDSVDQLFADEFASVSAALSNGWDAWVLITKKGAVQNYNESIVESNSSIIVQTEADAVVFLLPITDHQPPAGSFAINSGSVETDSTRVTLDLSGIVDAGSNMFPGGKMMFSNDGVVWSVEEFYKPAREWYLIKGNGQKTVYARFRDHFGNWTGVLTAGIQLNEPERVVAVAEDNAFTSGPEVCVDSEGQRVNVFYTSGSRLFVKSSDNGGLTFSASEQIPLSGDNGLLTDEGFKVDCHDNGVIYAVWVNQRAAAYHIYMNVSRDFGRTWLSQPVQVDRSPGDARGMQMCSDDAGRLAVVWEDSRILETAGNDIFANVSVDFGQTWFAQDTLLNTPAEINREPQIICQPENRLAVAWFTQEDFFNLGVHVSLSLDDGASWSDQPVYISFPADGLNWNIREALSLKLDQNGQMYLFGRSTGLPLVNRSLDGGQTWLPQNKLIRYLSVSRSSYEVFDNGFISAVWVPTSSSKELLYTYSYDFGHTWLSQPVNLLNSSTLHNNIVDIKTFSNQEGYLGVVWRDDKQNLFVVHSYDFGQTFTREERLNISEPMTIKAFLPDGVVVNNVFYTAHVDLDADSLFLTTRKLQEKPYQMIPDYNLDGIVSIGDLSILAGHYRSANNFFKGDSNFDGHVTLGDLSLLAENYKGTLHDPTKDKHYYHTDKRLLLRVTKEGERLFYIYPNESDFDWNYDNLLSMGHVVDTEINAFYFE